MDSGRLSNLNISFFDEDLRFPKRCLKLQDKLMLTAFNCNLTERGAVWLYAESECLSFGGFVETIFFTQ